MELTKMRTLGATELAAEEKTAAEQLFRLRFAKSLGKQEGGAKIRSLKKDIARLKTIAREQQSAERKAGR